MNNKILITKSSMPDLEEYIDEIRELWDSHWITNMGTKHKCLEKKLLEYLEVSNIELLVNGHMSLELALQAFELSGEVITTPFTFASTTHAIVRNGLTPVFCDINPIDFTMDASKLEALITEKTTAILPVHVYGNICDMEVINCIAKKYHLKVIYDAAHAFGEKYQGIGIGTFGDASCFSFHATKVYNTIEGGAVCYQDEKIGKRIYDLKNFGIRGPEEVGYVGANAKMNEFQAAMGICNLRHINEEIAKRKQVSERYRERIEGVDGIQLNPVQKEVTSNYAYFPVIFDEKKFGFGRNEIFERLRQRNIYTRKYFYPLTNTFSCFNRRYDDMQTPTAKRIADQVLTIPLYPDLSLAEVDLICDIILEGRK